jgi:hypothetical protein
MENKNKNINKIKGDLKLMISPVYGSECDYYVIPDGEVHSYPGTKLGINCTCGAKATLRCGACKMVSYCSVECQKSSWIRHKELCSGVIRIVGLTLFINPKDKYKLIEGSILTTATSSTVANRANLKNFLRLLNPTSNSTIVDVIRHPKAMAYLSCVGNVAKCVNAKGGCMVFGFQIVPMEKATTLLGHAVWKVKESVVLKGGSNVKDILVEMTDTNKMQNSIFVGSAWVTERFMSDGRFPPEIRVLENSTDGLTTDVWKEALTGFGLMPASLADKSTSAGILMDLS